MNLSPESLTSAILLPTVKHTGTNFTLGVLGGRPTKIDKNGNVQNPWADVVMSHFDKRTPHIKEYARHIKTVIPLRHPALVAVSWKKRKQSGWLAEWLNMCEVEGFYFPMETKPFDELEEFIGAKVNRLDTVINSIGEYDEKKNLTTARDFLGSDWVDVEIALNTEAGRIYAESIRGFRP